MYCQKKITKDNIYDFFVKEYIYSSTTAALLKILRTYFTAQTSEMQGINTLVYVFRMFNKH